MILSASVTFISLPGLDDVSRLSGLISMIFAASSMISTVIALFRYKADVDRSIIYVGGGEGLVLLSVSCSPQNHIRDPHHCCIFVAEAKHHHVSAHCLPCLGYRGIHDRHRLLLLPRCTNHEQDQYPTTFPGLHALGTRGHDGRSRWNAAGDGTTSTTMS